MAKLIGTGKDPRFPKGQDYDVFEGDLQHHVDAGLGEPVEPGTEAYAVHRGYDTIAADPGEDVGRPPVQADYEGANRVAARVETTAFEGDVLEPEAAVDQAAENADEVGTTEGALNVTEDGGTTAADTSEEESAAKTRGARAGAKSGADKEEAEAKTGKKAGGSSEG